MLTSMRIENKKRCAWNMLMESLVYVNTKWLIALYIQTQ